MTHRNFAACVVLVCLVSACGDDESSAGTRREAPGFDFAAFDLAVENFLVENELAGASGVIVHEDYGIVHERGYGTHAAERLYLVASSSKILSVGILMRLSDQGLIDLDAPISSYLSSWGNYKSDISVAQLLSNSSGLVGLIDDPLYAPYICQYLPTGTLTECSRSIYAADDEADRVPPDSAFRYGGGQWQLAGGIAEVVSGKTWSELLEETYGRPCGMPNTGYSNHFSQAASGGDVASALGYPDFFEASAQNLPQTDNPSIEGGAYTTVNDYARVLLMHLRRGLCGNTRVLSEQSVARMQEDRIAEAYAGVTIDSTLTGYGLGWWIDREYPGFFADGGAYGAMPWLDLPRKYGAFLILEANAGLGAQLRLATRPILEGIFDGAKR